MSWAVIAIVAVCGIVVGWCLTVLWFRRRTSGVVSGTIRARAEADRQAALQQEQGRGDAEALEQLEKNFGGEGQ